MNLALHAIVVPAAASVLPVTLVVAAALVVAGVSKRVGIRTIVWRVLVVAYLGALVAATFFPFIAIPDAAWGDSWRYGVNTVPFRSRHLRSFWLNIVMTVPLGVIVASWLRGRGWRLVSAAVAAIGAGLMTSIGIELLQLVLAVTIGGTRSTDVDDVIANTAGAAVGAVAFALGAGAVTWWRARFRSPQRSVTSG